VRRPFITAFALFWTLGVSVEGWSQQSAASPTPLPSPGILGDYDEPPRALKMTQPKYPTEVFRRRVSGTVLLRVVIDTEGKVKDPRVIRGIPELDAAALDATKGWRFAPARKAGQPVQVTVDAPVSFKVFQ
jgi:protein TonB